MKGPEEDPRPRFFFLRAPGLLQAREVRLRELTDVRADYSWLTQKLMDMELAELTEVPICAG